MQFPIASHCRILIDNKMVTRENITAPATKLLVQRYLAVEAGDGYQLDMPERAMVLLDAYLAFS